MKTIEERAKEYKKKYFSKVNDLFQSVAKVAYVVGATEQKKIDIEKACEWLRIKKDFDEGCQELFRKIMEE